MAAEGEVAALPVIMERSPLTSLPLPSPWCSSSTRRGTHGSTTHRYPRGSPNTRTLFSASRSIIKKFIIHTLHLTAEGGTANTSLCIALSIITRITQ